MPHFVIAGAAITPMGITKVANQPVNADTADLKLVGWAPRTGYSDTNIVDNEIIAVSANVILRARVQLTAAWNTTFGNLRVTVMRNGIELQNVNFVNGTSALALPDLPLAVVNGDRLWLRMTNTTSPSFALNATVQGGENTYLTAGFS